MMATRVFERTVSQEVIEAFRQVCVPCISDVVHGLRLNCVFQGLKPLLREWKICGPALTIRLIPQQDRENWYKEEQHPGSLTNIAKPGDVIVIDQGGCLDYTIWGGNTATHAKVAGLGGVVIDGACRDSSQIIAAGCPTFARSTNSLHGHGIFRSTCYNSEPVQIGTISVAPGDLVIGDADAIVVIPAARAAEILPLAQELHAMDEAGNKRIAAGDSAPPLDPQTKARNHARKYELKGLVRPPEGFIRYGA
jgi:regulator of RNase E activity RraA